MRGEGDAGGGGGCGDVDPALFPIVAGFEIDRAGRQILAWLGEDPEMIPRVSGADDGTGFVETELGFDTGFGSSFEESEDTGTVVMFWLRLGGGGVCGCFLHGIMMDGVVNLVMGSIQGEIVFVELGRMI